MLTKETMLTRVAAPDVADGLEPCFKCGTVEHVIRGVWVGKGLRWVAYGCTACRTSGPRSLEASGDAVARADWDRIQKALKLFREVRNELVERTSPTYGRPWEVTVARGVRMLRKELHDAGCRCSMHDEL